MNFVRNIILLAVSVLVTSISFAQAALECRVVGGPRSEFRILKQGQSIELYPRAIPTIYSCGPFVNDGSYYVSEGTVFIDVPPDACVISNNFAVQTVIYCIPPQDGSQPYK